MEVEKLKSFDQMAFEGKKLDLSKIASGVRGTKEASDLVDILEGHFDEIRAQVDL